MKGKRLANYIVKLIKEKKGENVVIVNVKKLNTIADYFVICTATVQEHSKAIYNEIKTSLKKEGNLPFSEEGKEMGEWIVIDYGDVIVHIMLPEKRDFYNLEQMWQEIKPAISKSRSH